METLAYQDFKNFQKPSVRLAKAKVTQMFILEASPEVDSVATAFTSQESLASLFQMFP